MTLPISYIFVMLAVGIGIGILMAAMKTKQNGLYTLCMIWSAVFALIAWFGPVDFPKFYNIDPTYGLLLSGFLLICLGAAHILVLICAVFLRPNDEN